MQNKPNTFEECLTKYGTEKEKKFFENQAIIDAIMDADDVAYKKLKICARAWNTNDETGEVWMPDYNNPSQAKYDPWARVKADESNPSGFGFSSTTYGYVSTGTGCGSRLRFPDAQTAMNFFDTFTDLYIAYWLIPQTEKSPA